MVRGKTGQKICLSENNFFWNVCFYWPLRSQKLDFIICTIIVKRPCGPSLIFPWLLSCPIWGKKTGQSFFFIGKNALFSSKFSVFNGILDLKKSSCGFRTNCLISFWTLKKCSLMFVTLDWTRKNSPKSFLHRKDCISFAFLSIAQKLSKYLVDPYYLPPDIFHVR